MPPHEFSHRCKTIVLVSASAFGIALSADAAHAGGSRRSAGAVPVTGTAVYTQQVASPKAGTGGKASAAAADPIARSTPFTKT